MINLNHNIQLTAQECIEILENRGISITYEPRVIFSESRDGALVNMSVFEAVSKLRIHSMADSTFNKIINKKI